MPWRASCCSAAAVASPISSTGCSATRRAAGTTAPAEPPGRSQSRRAATAPPPDLRVLQRPGRFRARRPRICDVLGPGQSTPAPWINVDRQSGVRLPGRGRGRRLHLVAATAARTSSRPGRTIRSATAPARSSTCATRRPASVESDGAADPRRAGALHRAARQGYSRFEHRGQRHRARAAAVRAARRSDQDLAADECATCPAGRAGCRSRPMSNGCSDLARGASAPYIVTEIDAATGAMLARNPWNIAIGSPRGVRRSARPADGLDRRPRANSSAATAPPAIPRR